MEYIDIYIYIYDLSSYIYEGTRTEFVLTVRAIR